MDTYGTFCEGTAWMWIADILSFFIFFLFESHTKRKEPAMAEINFLLASTEQKCLQRRQKSVLLILMVLTWL